MLGFWSFFLLISRSSLYITDITALSGKIFFFYQRLLNGHVSLSVEKAWDGVAPGGPDQIVSQGWGGHPQKGALAANDGSQLYFLQRVVLS